MLAAFANAQVAAYLQQHETKGLLRFITCGSVDDGKSTLIGRLLHDTKLLLDDQVSALEADSRKHGTQNGEIDFALLGVIGLWTIAWLAPDLAPDRFHPAGTSQDVADDELVEITPKSIRMRKRILDEGMRKRSERQDRDREATASAGMSFSASSTDTRRTSTPSPTTSTRSSSVSASWMKATSCGSMPAATSWPLPPGAPCTVTWPSAPRVRMSIIFVLLGAARR